MDDKLDALLHDFAVRGSSMFLGPKRRDAALKKPARINGKLFSKFVLAVALRALNFPVTVKGELQAYTEGEDDRGLDGLAIAVGQTLLTSIEDLNGIVQANGFQQAKIVFIQSKLLDEAKDQRIEMNEVSLFGSNILNFITSNWTEYEKANTNNFIARQHRIYHGLKAIYEGSGRGWKPVIYVVFSVSRAYAHYSGPSQAHDSNARLIQTCLPGARIAPVIWGDDELVAQAQRIGIRTRTKLLSTRLLPVPAGSATAAYFGIVRADALIEAFSANVAGEDQLLEHFFSDNPRAQLEVTENSSPGAFGIRRTLRASDGSDILLGHNGVVITARAATVVDGVVDLTAAQVVNGYQSCHAFFEMRGRLKKVMVPLKIIVTELESVRDEVIIASNSQALIDGFDILACRSEVRALQGEFHQLSWREPQRLWLQRRRNEQLEYPDGEVEVDRTLRPKDLVNGFGATVWGHPHTVHSDSRWALTKARNKEIFSEQHDPSVYHAIGWLIVVGRRWGRRQQKPVDWHLEGGHGSYAARHQFTHALWRIVDDTPDEVDVRDLVLAGNTKSRFQKIIARLTGPHGETLADWAAEAVAAGNAASEPHLKAFTEAAARAADELRTKRQGLGL